MHDTSMAVIVGPMLVAMLMLVRYARAVQVRVGMVVPVLVRVLM